MARRPRQPAAPATSARTDLAFRRVRQRARDNPLRCAHVDPTVLPREGERTFVRVSMDAPSLEVDTTDGYRPSLDQIVAFVNRPAHVP